MNIDWSGDEEGKNRLAIKTDLGVLMGSAEFNRSNNFTVLIVKDSDGKNVYRHSQTSTSRVNDEIKLAQKEILKNYKRGEDN